MRTWLTFISLWPSSISRLKPLGKVWLIHSHQCMRTSFLVGMSMLIGVQVLTGVGVSMLTGGRGISC